MSNFSDIHAALLSRLASLFPSASGWNRLANPYTLEVNNGLWLAKGYGLALTPGGTNTNRFACSTRSYAVQIQIPFTRRVDALNHDAAAHDTTDKALMGDLETLLDDAHANDLGLGEGVSTLGSHFGIQNIGVEDTLFRALICNVTVEYFRRN